MIKINLLEPNPTYIGVDFGGDGTWSEHAERINAHLEFFGYRTGGRTGWVYKPGSAHDIYVMVDEPDAARYLREAEATPPSCVFVSGINPMEHLAWYPETAQSAGNNYSEYMEVGAA